MQKAIFLLGIGGILRKVNSCDSRDSIRPD